MKKNHYPYRLILILLISSILFPTSIVAEQYKDIDSYRILFLSSYSPAWDSVPHQISGLCSTLDPFLYTVQYEFMDVKNIRYSKNYKEFYDLLSYKLDNVPAFDGVIVGDDAALKFIQIYRNELFKDIPIVFQGIDDIENAILTSKDPLMTGIVEKSNYAINLELAKTIQPNARDLIILYDSTETGLGILKKLKKEDALFSDYKVHYINSSHYTRAELCTFFEEFPEEYIIFLTVMGEGKGGMVYSDSDVYHIINKHIKYPVYKYTYAGIGKGVFGGYIVDHELCSNIAGQMMISILEKDIMPELVIDTPHSYIFDYYVMEEYKIDKSQLPKEAIIINKPEDFFDKYNKLIINTLIMGIGVLMLGLYFNTLSRRKLLATNVELSETKKTLTYQNYHDHLTNLPNRKSIVKDLEILFKKNIPHTAIIIDIDDFKEINMAHGNDYGDKVLNIISQRLLELSENKNIKISRFSGDEFLVLIQGNNVAIDEIILRIQEIFSKVIKIDNTELFIQISIGIATCFEGLDNGLSIISNASLALDEAKKHGKNTIIFYDNKMKEHFIDKKKIEDILMNACQNDGFKLLYQPQVDMGANIVGYEALLRLKDNVLYPGKFIPIAESTDLILRVGRIVTRKVIKQLANWRENGMELKPVSINFSSRQIRDKSYVEFLDSLLKEYKLNPTLIEIEVTENILVNNDKEAEELFSKLLSIGVSLSLDDFGTGYSSIRYLTYLPVNKIKIDKSLVEIFLNKNNGEFIGNIIRLSHSLGLDITIEGVETFREYEIIKNLGGDFIQGYYFSKPIEAKEVENLNSPIIKT